MNRNDLHQYQNQMVQYIKDTPKCSLFLDMGLGKSIIALTAVTDLFDDMAVNKVLIIAPLRPAVHTWPKEISSWGHTKHLTYKVLAGLTAAKRLAALRDKSDIHIINRENIPWLIKTLKSWPYDLVVVDESHSFKSPKAQRFKALKKAVPHINRMINLTGTPSTNGLMGLWAQLYLLDTGQRLGRTFSMYRDRYWQGDYMGFSYELRPGSEENIHDKIKDICVAMKSDDYLDMPDRLDNIIEVTLPDKIMKQYKELEKEAILSVGDDAITADQAAALINKLMQFCNGAVYTEDGYIIMHDYKLDALAEIIESGKPVLVAYTYISDKERIQKRFTCATLDDDNVIDKWNKGEVPVLLIHPASGGAGLNLQQGGSTLVWFGPTYNLEHKLQMDARLHRQGQEETVIIHTLTIPGSIEDKVLQALDNKDISQKKLLNALISK